MRFSLITLFFTLFLGELMAGNPTQTDTIALEKMDVYALLDKADLMLFSDLETAKFINEKAFQKGKKAKDWVAVLYTLRERGFYYEKYNLPKSALMQYSLALPFLDSLKENKSKFQCILWNDIAITQRKIGDYKACAAFHEKTLQLAIQTKNVEMQENSYHGLGLLCEAIGEWEKAAEYYQKSVNIAQNSGNKVGIVISYQNIAKVLLASGNEKLALLKIEDAWKLSQPLDSNRQAHVLNDYGEILSQTGRYNEALSKFQQSLVWYEQLSDKPMIGRAMINMANTYAQKGENPLAIDFFNKSLALKESIRSEDLVKLWFNLGQLYQKQNNLAKAQDAYFKSQDLAQHFNFRADLQKSFLGISQTLAMSNYKAEAYNYLQKASTLGDSLAGFEKERRIAEMDFRFKASQSEKKIAILEAEKAKITFGSTAFGALFLAAFLYFMFWQKDKHNKILQEKNQEILLSNKQLRESNEVLQQFAYATAHDLKEPLRTIGSFVGLLQRRFGKSFDPEAIEYFEFVKSGAFRMNALLTDLLEYSTVFMDTPNNAEQTAINNGFEDVFSNLHNSIRENEAQIDFPKNVNLQPLMIKKSHFIQLFQNLLCNAIKFSPINPSIQVSISETNSNEYIFEIRDNGIGIEPAYQDKVFQIFQRLNRKDFGGQGIGLAVCKKIVEKYNGSIWFESKLGVGTSFFVRLPYKVESNVLAVAA
jgi:signal transduction histidine kinase